MLSKHREERDVYAIDFANEIAAGETLNSPIVEILKGDADVTDEFITETVAISGSTVQFWLEKAVADDEQLAGKYRIKCTVITSNDRELVAQNKLQRLHSLIVNDD